jgi:deazaflavin-dependent oxidoreductase (nitroreductase family)
MTVTVTRRIPPQRLIDVANPVVRAVAGSPLQRVLDAHLLVLHITGRRTGRRYSIPVGFAALGDALLVVTQHRWRANLRSLTDVTVSHRGHTRPMTAELVEEPAAVAAVLAAAIERIGRAEVGRRFGLTLPGDVGPAELEAAVREYHLATITLRDR